MNEQDLNNLDFLLSLDTEGLTAWFVQASPDDVKYAMALMQEYQSEIYTEQALNSTEWIESQVVLERFRLH
jgi:hypothetical protein